MNILKGGYALIDCGGLDLSLTADTQTIDDIYETIRIALLSNKPIYACNCKMGDNTISPIQLSAYDIGADGVVVLTSVYEIVISKLDVITVTNLTEVAGD